MASLNIIYFPEEGNKQSPIGLLKSLCNPNEIANFIEKLDQLAEFGPAHWQFAWLERFQNMYQVRQGDFRLYFEIINDQMVVTHVCRKVDRIAQEKDLARARMNLKDYRGK